ncbi:MAG: hypothetical protein ACXWET_05985 [Halobacteriota archaeon]
MTDDAKSSWYSVSFEYKPIPSDLRPDHGEWYLQASLIHEYRDPSGGILTEKTPLGSIDVDHIDSVELRQAFYAATDEALDALQLQGETRTQIAAELRLVVRPPTEDIAKRPRIGLGVLLPDKKY